MKQNRLTLAICCLTLALSGCGDHGQLRPEDQPLRNSVVLESGDLKLRVVDNTAFGDIHRAGYNGIAELSHTAQDSLVFAPRYAGFNLEHIFGGDSLADKFEPRRSPMSLFEGDGEALLYQPATPTSHVESLTRFRLTPPHYVDVVFRCVVHDLEHFDRGYAGLFWASYIQSPTDKQIYFQGRGGLKADKPWVRAFSETHGETSTHVGPDDHREQFEFAPDFNVTLANHFSDYQFETPFYFGRFHNMVLAYMFDAEDVIRFSQSPDGGGGPNPAWDFQFLIPDVEKNREYSFRVRIVYKPFVSAEDIEAEYRSWKSTR